METTIKALDNTDVNVRIEGDILQLGKYFKIDLRELYSLLEFSELPPLSDSLQDLLLSISQFMAERINDLDSEHRKIAPESVSIWQTGVLIEHFQRIQVFK